MEINYSIYINRASEILITFCYIVHERNQAPNSADAIQSMRVSERKGLSLIEWT